MSLRTLVAKDARDVLRERTLVVAFLVQLVLAAFSTLLITGLSALYDPDAAAGRPTDPLAYIGEGGFAAVMERDGITVHRMDTAAATEAFLAGSVAAVVEERTGDVTTVRILIPDGEVTTTLLVTHLKGLLLQYEDDLRAERGARLALHAPPVPDAPRTAFPFAHAVLLPVLVLTPVFLSGAIAGDAFTQEARTRTLTLLRASPLRPLALVTGKLVVPILLVPLQVALWLALFSWRGHAAADPLGILAWATVLAALVCGVALLVAVAVRHGAATQAAYALAVLALATSSLWLPRDPLNAIALLSAGTADGAVWTTLSIITAAAAATVAAAAWWATRRLRADAL